MSKDSPEPQPEIAAAPAEWPLTRLAFTAFAVGLLGNLANLLNYHAYPLLKPEIGLLIVVLLLAAFLAAALHRLARPRLSFIFTALFIAVLIDLGAEIEMETFAIIAGVIAVLAWFQERLVLKLAIAAFASVLLFQTLGLITGLGRPERPANEAKRLQAANAGNAELPPIVHLMLDSYMGLDGMNAPGTHFGTLRAEQERFYLEQGFQLYPQAYSRHGKTVNSLPEMFSYGQGERASQPRNVQFTTAPELPYFVDLDREGYRTSASTPSFVDLCVNQPLTLCRNYNRSDLSSLTDSSLSAIDRARIIGLTLIELSKVSAIPALLTYNQFGRLAGTERRRLFNRTKLYSLTGFAQFDAFTADLATLKAGEARFIHLLVPHDPFIMDDTCSLLPEPQWIDEHGPASFAARDAAYARQLRCLTNGAIARMLTALDNTEAGRSAIVIIHGDHGSRTIDAVPTSDGPDPDERAMTLTHSAFFAMRVPGEAAAIRRGRAALDELIGGFAATGFAAAPEPAGGPAEVFLMDRMWIPRKPVPLPEFTGQLTSN